MDAPLADDNKDNHSPYDADLHHLLHAHFGYETFRPLQLTAMSSLLSGQDVLLILPTGGGKSLTFQLPAVLRNQISIIVTPLLALAQDQVEIANDLHDIEAASWSSQVSDSRKASLTQEIIADDGSLRLLYVTPEALHTEKLIDVLTTAHTANRLCCFAVDEAHCCSTWGHDFRPSYLSLGDVRAKLPGLPVIAVTATATPHVQSSIVSLLNLHTPRVLVGSFNRPNLQFNVVHKELLGDGSKQAVLQEAVRFIHNRPASGESGIVYCRLRTTCDEVASALRDADIDAASYHAGLDITRRSRVQQDWKDGGYAVVVATIAFGMGIDKADVRYVLHLDPPSSLEGLYQEAGRGGRDGLPAVSLVFSSNEDLRTAQKMEKSGSGGGGATRAVAEYLQQPRCRRKALLAHFNERRGLPCAADQGEELCDYCKSPGAVARQIESVEEKLIEAAIARRTVAGVEEEEKGKGKQQIESDDGNDGPNASDGGGASGGNSRLLLLQQQPEKVVPRRSVCVPAKRKPFVPVLTTARTLKAAAEESGAGELKGKAIVVIQKERMEETMTAVKKRRPFTAPRRILN